MLHENLTKGARGVRLRIGWGKVVRGGTPTTWVWAALERMSKTDSEV